MEDTKWYIAKEKNETKKFKEKIEKAKRGFVKQQIRYKTIILAEILRKEIDGEFEYIYYAKIQIPFIGEFYIQEGTPNYSVIYKAIEEQNEKHLHDIISELIEEKKEEIDIFDLFVGMLSYTDTQKKNTELITRADMQRQFRELIGIEE